MDVRSKACSSIQRLPEGCISHVLSLTSPRDACRASLVSTTFRSAAESDAVWEKFLPPDYHDVLSRAVEPLAFSSKKELYLRLCHPILIDGGRKSFALDRFSGGKCYMLSARELELDGGNDQRKWTWIPLPDSRFVEVAKPLDACRLAIHGKIDSRLLSLKTTYVAYLIFKIVGGARRFCGSSTPPIQEVVVKLGAFESTNIVRLPSGAVMRRSYACILRPPGFRHQEPTLQNKETDHMPKTSHKRDDGWMEIELGEFFNYEGDDGDLEMRLGTIKEPFWEPTLIIQGIEVRPKK